MSENENEFRQELSDDDLDGVSGGVYTVEKDCARMGLDPVTSKILMPVKMGF